MMAMTVQPTVLQLAGISKVCGVEDERKIQAGCVSNSKGGEFSVPRTGNRKEFNTYC